MRKLWEASKVLAKPLHKCELRTFLKEPRDLPERRCLSLLILICNSDAKGQERSAVRDDVAMKRRSGGCTATTGDLISDLTTNGR